MHWCGELLIHIAHWIMRLWPAKHAIVYNKFWIDLIWLFWKFIRINNYYLLPAVVIHGWFEHSGQMSDHEAERSDWSRCAVYELCVWPFSNSIKHSANWCIREKNLNDQSQSQSYKLVIGSVGVIWYILRHETFFKRVAKLFCIILILYTK